MRSIEPQKCREKNIRKQSRATNANDLNLQRSGCVTAGADV